MAADIWLTVLGQPCQSPPTPAGGSRRHVLQFKLTDVIPDPAGSASFQGPDGSGEKGGGAECAVDWKHEEWASVERNTAPRLTRTVGQETMAAETWGIF